MITTIPKAAHLSDAQRRELLALIQDHPDATLARIRDRFEASTGRRIATGTVRRAWVVGYRSPGRTDRRRPLRDEQRALLLDLSRAAAPDFNYCELARRFEAIDGRRLRSSSVRKFVHARFEVPSKRRPGPPRRKGVPGC